MQVRQCADPNDRRQRLSAHLGTSSKMYAPGSSSDGRGTSLAGRVA
jgi:hypothetical protein